MHGRHQTRDERKQCDVKVISEEIKTNVLKNSRIRT